MDTPTAFEDLAAALNFEEAGVEQPWAEAIVGKVRGDHAGLAPSDLECAIALPHTEARAALSHALWI